MGTKMTRTHFSNLDKLFLERFGCKCICTHGNLTRVLITVQYCVLNLDSSTHNVHLGCLVHTLCQTVPVLPHPGITMHNSCSKVLSADKSHRLHLLFIGSSSHDESFNKQKALFFFSLRCLCFGKDLTGFISRGVKRNGGKGGRK